jgi:hypothetical protein
MIYKKHRCIDSACDERWLEAADGSVSERPIAMTLILHDSRGSYQIEACSLVCVQRAIMQFKASFRAPSKPISKKRGRE